jgi:glycerol-3-phosphate acyltransferase PlsY
MLGHIYPVFFGFKGGKAVACSVGTFAVCCPIAIILGLIGFAACLFFTKIVSLSSLLATVIVISVASIYEIVNISGAYNIIPVIIMALIAGFIVFIKHKDNISRLVKGTEAKISAKKG